MIEIYRIESKMVVFDAFLRMLNRHDRVWIKYVGKEMLIYEIKAQGKLGWWNIRIWPEFDVFFQPNSDMFFPKMKGFMSLEKCTISKRKSCSNHLSVLAFGGVKQHLKNSLDLVPFGDFCRSVTPTVTGSFLNGDNTYKVGPYNLYKWSYNPPIGGFINGQLGL